jgi:thiamine biosynthesis protein ThiS
MTISLNGENTDPRGATTVAELVRVLNLPAPTLLIEHNGVALHRREWIDRALSDGDRIELIKIVAGG